jgi:hypothetical protein
MKVPPIVCIGGPGDRRIASIGSYVRTVTLMRVLDYLHSIPANTYAECSAGAALKQLGQLAFWDQGMPRLEVVIN